MGKEIDSKTDDNCYIKEFDSNASTSGISAFTSSSVASSSHQSRHVTPEVAIREQRDVRWSKVLVFCVLLMAVSAVATATYIIIIGEEEAEFEYQVSLLNDVTTLHNTPSFHDQLTLLLQ